MKKVLTISLLMLLWFYFGMALKTSKVKQSRLERQVKQGTIKAPDFNEKMKQASLFNILLQPLTVLNTD